MPFWFDVARFIAFWGVFYFALGVMAACLVHVIIVVFPSIAPGRKTAKPRSSKAFLIAIDIAIAAILAMLAYWIYLIPLASEIGR